MVAINLARGSGLAPKVSKGIGGSSHLVVGAAFFFSLCTACAKGAGRRIPTFEKVFIRSFLNVLFVAVTQRKELTEIWYSLGLKPKLLLAARGCAGFIALFCYFEGTQHLPLSDLTIITRFHPVLSSIFCAWALGEVLTQGHYLSFALSLVGVCCVAQPTGQGSWLGSAIALTAAIFTAVAFTLVRTLALLGVPRSAIIFAFHFASVPLSAMLGWTSFIHPSPVEWVWLCGTALTMQLAQMCMTELLERRQVASAAPSSFLTIFWNTLFGTLLGDNLPNPMAWLGCAFIVGPLVVAEWRELAKTGKP